MASVKKIACLIAAFSVLCISASADYLQTADEAPENKAAEASRLREYVYESGAAASPESEMKRIYILNYSLNREKQKSDYAQSFCENAFEMSGKHSELEFLSGQAYAYAEKSNELKAEIEKNEAYLSRINSDKDKLARAEELASGLAPQPVRKNPARLWLDIAGFAAAAAGMVLALVKIRSLGEKEGWK